MLQTITPEATAQAEAPTALRVFPINAGDSYICPISGTTTCTASEEQQRTCSAC